MRTGFVILCSDEAELLKVALAAAVAERFGKGLVIDNASTDATAAVAESFGVPILRLERRLPYTEAMNAGLTALLGETREVDLVAFLQADTFISPGYLSTCAAALADHAVVGCVAPKLIRTTGPAPQDRLAVIDAAAMSFDRRRKNSLVGHGAPAADYSSAVVAFGADGAAAVWRSAALIDCAVEGHPFDENMPGWGCDADLAWRAQLFGWESLYIPEAVVHHIRTYSPTTRASVAPADRATQFRNRLLMIAKNDTFTGVLRDLLPLLSYEILAFGYAVLRERELLGAYAEFWRRLPEALRQRRLIQRRRRVGRVPFGLKPPA